MSFTEYKQMEESFLKQVRASRLVSIDSSSLSQDIHPGDLKNGIAGYLNRFLEPIRKEFETDEMKKLILDAYPPPAPVQVKKSK